MPNKERNTNVEKLRYAEYYDLQKTFDKLFQQSSERKPFDDLTKIIFSEENIKLAYRNIKSNHGSKTPGTDKLTIEDIARLDPEEVVKRVRNIAIESKHGYRPRPVRRKEIPKPNGKMRPLGIPCIWDRLVQQCIVQVLEPIVEARFSKNSYGFRPNRCVEHAIAESHRLMQKSNLHYVIEFDIEGFFDNVDHQKLIKQIWAIGIRDKTLIFLIKRILEAPIKLPNGKTEHPQKGTPQGGIISPILANIVLNELDQWIDGQWIDNPIVKNSKMPVNKSGVPIKTTVYYHMRKTKLKEMYIIRYADDFRIFCRDYATATRAKYAITDWIENRLKLKISQEKTRIVNAEKGYMEFLGFKLKMEPKAKKQIVKSHVSDKKLENVKRNLTFQIRKLNSAKDKYHATSIIRKYNVMVLGVQNYYCIATKITEDFREVQYGITSIMESKLHGTAKKNGKFSRTKGRQLSAFEVERYGKTKAIRYYKENGEPIYPIGYVQPKPPISKSNKVCIYTEEGRKGLYENLKINPEILRSLMLNPVAGQSLEYNDNRISLYSGQRGRCAITQRVFQSPAEIHCHHKTPKEIGGTDEYKNLMLVTVDVHRLIHAVRVETIAYYMDRVKPTELELKKINKYRALARKENI